MQFSEAFQKLAKKRGINLSSLWNRLLGYKELSYLYWRLDWRSKTTNDIKSWLSEQMLIAENYTPIRNKVTEFKKIQNKDRRILAIFKWVCEKVTYKTDSLTWNTKEKWQSPVQTYMMGSGDCEDGSILLFVVARLAGIDTVRLVCGEVKTQNGFGGHAWVSYVDDLLEEYYFDWTVRDYKEIPARIPASMQEVYTSVWFKVDDKVVWKR